MVGAGVGGLCAAWAARARGELGEGSAVLEAEPRVGGSIHTIDVGAAIYDCGATSTLVKHESVRALLKETGLESDVMLPPATAKRRYVLLGGKLVPLPGGPGGLLTTRLFDARDKLRIFGEPMRRAPADGVEESVAQLVTRRLGKSFLDNALGPFIGSGIYAGDPARLSARHAMPMLWELEKRHGSFAKGALASAREKSGTPGGGRPQLTSFRGGMRTLPERLAGRLGDSIVRTGHRVESLKKSGAGTWRVEGTTSGGAPFVLDADRLVLAMPAPITARLLAGIAPEAAALAEIPYSAVANVFTVYRREQVAFPLDGFGFLRSLREKSARVLGCIFSSSLFPDRAPGGEVALTSFYGGRLDPDAAALDTAALEALAHRELTTILGVTGAPIAQASRRWGPAIPQYEVGHARFQDLASAIERSHPTLRLLGNWRNGVSVGDVMANALTP